MSEQQQKDADMEIMREIEAISAIEHQGKQIQQLQHYYVNQAIANDKKFDSVQAQLDTHAWISGFLLSLIIVLLLVKKNR